MINEFDLKIGGGNQNFVFLVTFQINLILKFFDTTTLLMYA